MRENTVTNLHDGAEVFTENVEATEEEDVMPPKKQKCSDKDQSYVRENDAGQGSGCEIKKPVRTPSRRPMKPPETASSVLMKYIVESDKESKTNDPIDLFFQSVAATVKKFSPYYQNMCKTKVFSIVSELEMTQILENTSPVESPTPTPGYSTLPPTIQNNNSSITISITIVIFTQYRRKHGEPVQEPDKSVK